MAHNFCVITSNRKTIPPGLKCNSTLVYTCFPYSVASSACSIPGKPRNTPWFAGSHPNVQATVQHNFPPKQQQHITWVVCVIGFMQYHIITSFTYNVHELMYGRYIVGWVHRCISHPDHKRKLLHLIAVTWMETLTAGRYCYLVINLFWKYDSHLLHTWRRGQDVGNRVGW